MSIVKCRQELMEIIGYKCIRCGIDDGRVLQFDHINGGGNEERIRFRSSNAMVRYYIRHPEEAIDKLQVLCANCNWIKRHERGEHGHIVVPVLNVTNS